MDLPLAVNPSGCARCEPRFRTYIKHRRHLTVHASGGEHQTTSTTGNGGIGSSNIGGGVIQSSTSSGTGGSGNNTATWGPSSADMRAMLQASGISADMIGAAYLRLEPGAVQSSSQYSQYQRMKKEWRQMVFLARSRIQGLGLYARHDTDMNGMIIEYKGEVIRNEVK